MDLTNKTVKELRELAKEHNIVGRWTMSKQELIDSLTYVDSTKTKKSTEDYLSNIVEGTLVAFKRSKNKNVAMSGKFVSFSDGKVVVESKRGTVFRVSPENIVWVKTGSRWPKWVYSMFNKTESEVDNDNAVS